MPRGCAGPRGRNGEAKMAIHKVRDKAGVHFYDDDEFKHVQRVGCFKSGCGWVLGILGLLVFLVLAMVGKG